MRLVEAAAGAPAGRVDYPTLGCSHTLQVDEFRADGVKLRQTLISGPCVTDNVIELRVLQPGKAAAQWYWPDGRPAATACDARARSAAPSALPANLGR
jgi:hypothetical protein